MFNTIMLYALCILCSQLCFIQDGIIIYNCLFLMFLISIVNFVREFRNNKIPPIVKELHLKLNKQHKQMVEYHNELVKETIKKLYFSMLYSAKNKNFDFFNKAKAELLKIGIDKELLESPTKLLSFIEDLNTNKIIFEFDKKNKKYIFKKSPKC